ncbi:MAG: hypothetical protein U0V70_03245 [Terriglobia bacterium]
MKYSVRHPHGRWSIPSSASATWASRSRIDLEIGTNRTRNSFGWDVEIPMRVAAYNTPVGLCELSTLRMDHHAAFNGIGHGRASGNHALFARYDSRDGLEGENQFRYRLGKVMPLEEPLMSVRKPACGGHLDFYSLRLLRVIRITTGKEIWSLSVSTLGGS